MVYLRQIGMCCLSKIWVNGKKYWILPFLIVYHSFFLHFYTYTHLNAWAVSPKPSHVTIWFDFLMALGCASCQEEVKPPCHIWGFWWNYPLIIGEYILIPQQTLHRTSDDLACVFCSSTFNDLKSLQDHTLQVHSTKNSKNPSRTTGDSVQPTQKSKKIEINEKIYLPSLWTQNRL